MEEIKNPAAWELVNITENRSKLVVTQGTLGALFEGGILIDVTTEVLISRAVFSRLQSHMRLPSIDEISMEEVSI